MNSIQLSPYFKAFFLALNAKRIEYLMVGGYAILYYGYLRKTKDLDIWTATSADNAKKIAEVFQSYAAGISELTPELFQHTDRIIKIGFPPVNIEILDPIIGQKPVTLQRTHGKVAEQIEILTVQTGVSFEACYTNRVVDTLDGIVVNIISLPDLIAIKQAGDRSKDKDDLDHLV